MCFPASKGHGVSENSAKSTKQSLMLHKTYLRYTVPFKSTTQTPTLRFFVMTSATLVPSDENQNYNEHHLAFPFSFSGQKLSLAFRGPYGRNALKLSAWLAGSGSPSLVRCKPNDRKYSPGVNGEFSLTKGGQPKDDFPCMV